MQSICGRPLPGVYSSFNLIIIESMLAQILRFWYIIDRK
jgi:hypothetical protein